MDGALAVAAAHRVAEGAEQALIRVVPRLLAATVHVGHASAAWGRPARVAEARAG
ncbi:hypothetical protein [Kitasatospora sp. NPDC056731]|uniref:hypothetical protein n=1 Tax=Kitasatospora sp. NPDC056731 TaxID=3155422 RepID=UPI003439C1C2